MKKTCFPLTTVIAIAALLLPECLQAVESIGSSNITQVVKDVSVIKAGTKTRKAARINDTFLVPDIMKTGADSRAEMIAPDQTVTRVGANTLFSFEPEKREVNLQKGSILFNSPAGKGGGTIKTAAATASVLGTTLIVVTTDNGGFKVLLLEGTGRVKTPKGRFRTLKAGQLVYALPGGDLSQALTFQLSQQVGASLLVGGFKKPLPSVAKIEVAISKQEAQIAKGQLQKTGLLAGNEADKAFQVDVNARDPFIQGMGDGADPLTGALATDAIVSTPKLDPARIFVFDVAPILLESGFGESFSTASNITLFAARNTTFRTPTVDLASFQPTQAFVFFSLQNIIVEQSVNILDTSSPVFFIAGGTFDFAPDVSLSTSAPEVFVFAFGGGLTATASDGSPPTSGTGELVLTGHASFISNEQEGGILRISAPAIKLDDGAYFAAEGDLFVESQGDFSITGQVTIDSDGGISTTDGLFAGVNLDVQAQGNVSIADSFVVAQNATIVSQKDLTATNVVFDYAQVPIGSSVHLQAANLMSLTNTAFLVQDVSLQARTIALRNVDFAAGSKVSLRSQSGQLAPNPNTNQPVRLGDVNFIQNVRHGGIPAQQAVSGGSITISK